MDNLIPLIPSLNPPLQSRQQSASQVARMGDYHTLSRGTMEIIPPEGHIIPPEGCIIPPEGGIMQPEGGIMWPEGGVISNWPEETGVINTL